MLGQSAAVVFACIMLGFVVPVVSAQQASPSVPLKFQVIDPSGAAVSGACVHIVGANKDFKLTMGADKGGWIVAILPIGSYEVTAASQGFHKVIKHVDVERSPAESVTLRLAVGVGSGLEVSAAPTPRLDIGPDGLPEIRHDKSDAHHESCTGCDCYFRTQ
jgi:hypothetical protein